MKIVADENIDGDLVRLLRQSGFEVVWITESSPSIDDWEVLRTAFEAGALLITEDKGISADVFEEHRQSSGILLLRVHGMNFRDRAQLVLETIRNKGPLLMGKFSVLTNERLRSRPIPDPFH